MEFKKSMTGVVSGLLLSAAFANPALAASDAPLSLSGQFEQREGKVLSVSYTHL